MFFIIWLLFNISLMNILSYVDVKIPIENYVMCVHKGVMFSYNTWNQKISMIYFREYKCNGINSSLITEKNDTLNFFHNNTFVGIMLHITRYMRMQVLRFHLYTVL